MLNGKDAMLVDSLEDVEKYYNDHKEEIEEAFAKVPKEGKEDVKLGNALKTELREIVQETGIINCLAIKWTKKVQILI